MKKILFIAPVTFFCLLTTGIASEIKTEPSSDEPFQSLLQNNAYRANPDIEFAKQQVLQSEAEYEEAKTQNKPKLNSVFIYFDERMPVPYASDYTEGKAMLQLPVFTGGRITKRIKQTKANVEATKQMYIKVGRNSYLEIKKNYYEILKTIQDKLVIEATARELKPFYALAYDRYKARVGIYRDVLKISSILSLYSDDVFHMDNTIKLLRARLNILLGREINENIDLPDQFFYPESFPETRDFTSASVIDSSPDVREAEARVDGKKMEVAIQKSQRFPQIGFETSYGAIGNNFDLKPDWRVIGSIGLPLFDWGEISKKVKKAEAEAEMQKIVAGTVRDNVRLSLMEVQNDLAEYHRKLSTDQALIKASTENWRVVKALFEQDNYGVLDLLRDLEEYKQSRMKYFNDLFQYHLALTRLEVLTGERMA